MAVLLILCLSILGTISASTDADCGNSSMICPNTWVELYCQTSVPVLIWSIQEIELDFTIKDTIGTNESSGGFTAQLTGRNNGTQSKLTFRMNPSVDGNILSCYDGIGSNATCEIHLTDFPGPPTNLTCQSDEYNSTVILVWASTNENNIQGYDVMVIPDTSCLNCSVMTYSIAPSTAVSLSLNIRSSYAYDSYVVRAMNCLGAGQGVTCTVEQGQYGVTTGGFSSLESSDSFMADMLQTNDLWESNQHTISTTDLLRVAISSTNQREVQASESVQVNSQQMQELLFVLLGAGAGVTVIGCCAVFLLASTLLVKKNYHKIHSTSASTHHEEEWFNMTSNVVYERPIQLQDNSAYASIH